MTEPSRNIHVFYSNYTEQLVEALGDELRRTGAFESVFDAPTILVPNWNLSRYLTFELSQRFGVAGDYFSTVEQLLEQTAGEDVQFLDDTRLQAAILSRLRDEDFLGEQAMESVSRYLDYGENESDTETARNVKRYQLAGRLAKNFRQYAHSRLGMIENWREGIEPFTEEDNYQSNERWQRALWNSLFDGEGRLRSEDDQDCYLLPEYYRRVDVDELDLPDRLHVFGVSHFAPVYGRIFEKLARATTLRFYVINPCREFWEDVIYDEDEEDEDELHDRREDVPDESAEETFTLDAEDSLEAPFALKAWGRAGRDLTHMLNTLSGYHFSERWVPPARSGDSVSLLEKFQQDVLDFERPEHDPDRWSGDESVQFLACKNKRREIEAVADEIWSLVRNDDSLSFEDVAVIVNPRKRGEYQSRIETVFEQVRDIPYNEIDFTRGERSRLMDGLEALLSLPAEPLQRENVLTVMTHPCFRGIGEEVDTDRIKEWVDELGIFHGGDRTDHEDTYLHDEGDLFNWDQGVRRLVLGYFMEGENEAGERIRFESGDGRYRPESVAETEVASAGTLMESARRLIASARSIEDQRRSLTGWFEWMADFIRTNFEPADAAEESEYHRYLDKLTELAELESGPESIEYEPALRFALDELGSLEYKPGNYLASGVVVSSFVPQRPIPFDVVFMLGMTEEDFPASSPRSPIDLNTERWQQGDLWDRDRERYMFFETLLSVRDAVYLSWVAEDPTTGEPIEPSSVLREFQRVLEGYVGEDGLTKRVQNHHLRRYDPLYFRTDARGDSGDDERPGQPATGPTYNPEAIAEATARRLRKTVIDRNDLPSVQELSVQSLPADAGELMRSVEAPDSEEHAEGDEEGDTPERLKVRALEKYFKSPLQAWAKYTLGLDEEDEETIVDRNEEPFETGKLWGTILPRNTYETAALQAGGSPDSTELERIYRDEKIRLQERGRAPAGVFGSVQRDKDDDLLEHWRRTVEEAQPDTLTRVRFGSAGEVPNVRTETPVTVDVETEEGPTRTVDLIGDTELFDPTSGTVFTFTRKIKPKRYLRGFLSGAVLLARGQLESGEFDLVLVGRDDWERRTFDLESPSSARAFLRERVRELLTETHDYRLPFGVSEDFLGDGGVSSGESFEQRVREQDAGSYGSTEDEWGPLHNVESYRTLGTDDPEGTDPVVEQTLMARLGPFWRGYFEDPLDELLEEDQA